MQQVPSSFSKGLAPHLSEKQKQCLRLVLHHKTSKEMALALGISSHAVDMRIRTAMAALGVSSRLEAALLLRRIEDRGVDSHSVYDPSELDHATMICDTQNHGFGRVSEQRGRHAHSFEHGRDCHQCADRSNFSGSTLTRSDFWDAFIFTSAKLSHPDDRHLFILKRIVLILAIVVISLIAFSSFLFAMQMFASKG